MIISELPILPKRICSKEKSTLTSYSEWPNSKTLGYALTYTGSVTGGGRWDLRGGDPSLGDGRGQDGGLRVDGLRDGNVPPTPHCITAEMVMTISIPMAIDKAAWARRGGGDADRAPILRAHYRYLPNVPPSYHPLSLCLVGSSRPVD